MDSKQEIIHLCARITSHFNKQGEWKNAATRRKDYVLIQHKTCDFYIFIGLDNKEIKDDIYRIGLAVKQSQSIELVAKHRGALEAKTGHQFERFKQRGLPGGVPKDLEKSKSGIPYWAKIFIAISYKEYAGDIPELLARNGEEAVKEMVLETYNQEWKLLTEVILEFLFK